MSKHKHFYITDYELSPEILEKAVDTHCHLDRFENAEEIISKFDEFALSGVITMAGGREIIELANNLSQKYESVFFAAGLHPYDADEYNEEYAETIREFAKKSGSRFVAIGEIGLDYYRNPSEEEKEKQKRVFLNQLKLAHELKKPVCLHIRNAHEDVLSILKENKNLLEFGGVIHCSSGDTKTTNEYLGLGFYVSFAGNVTYKFKETDISLAEVAKTIPLEKLLIETDAPFLSPTPYRGQESQPKLVLLTADFLANVLEMDVNKLIKQTRENAEKLFGLKK